MPIYIKEELRSKCCNSYLSSHIYFKASDWPKRIILTALQFKKKATRSQVAIIHSISRELWSFFPKGTESIHFDYSVDGFVFHFLRLES